MASSGHSVHPVRCLHVQHSASRTDKNPAFNSYGLDPMVHRDQILSTIADITKIDPNRRGYYDDVKSKYEWEWAVNTSAETGHPKDGALNMT